MQLSDEQIVKILIANYKQAGVDLAFIVFDPVFNALPLGAKVEALKEHAQELAQGTRKGFTKDNLKPVLVDAGFGALGGLAAASTGIGLIVKERNLARTLAHNSAARNARLFGAGLGAAFGAVGSLLETKNSIDNRNSAIRTLNHLHRNPTDETALMALSRLQRPSSGGVMGRVLTKTRELAARRFDSTAPGIIGDQYKELRPDVFPKEN